MAGSKKKCRQYSVDYLKFGFIPALSDKQLPRCLLCNKVLSNDAMKSSKLEDHLRRCHPDKTGKDLKYFQTLKDKVQKRPTVDKMFASTSQRDDDGLRASYNISLLLAKSGKPHTIGEKLILPAIEEVLKTVLHKPASDIIKRIPLDESTLPGNEALLLAYVRFIMNQEIHEELLLARTLTTDTKGESIFNVLMDYFMEKAIPLSNTISVATDGAPAMVGRYRGFISHLKQNVPGVLAIHCVIHRQHLVAKNLSDRLHESLQLVINAVNRIRSNALNTRLFAQLCEENDENFHQLLLHTEVRWLSKGLCLTRFFALFETVLEFSDAKDPILKQSLIKWKADITYLTDLFSKFNEVNLQLQGDSLNLIKTKSIISAFLARIKLMKQNIGRGEFSQFPNLSQTYGQEDDVSTYVQHLNALYSDFETRFEDVLTIVIPQWIINPYGDIEETDVILQEELIGISTNEEIKVCEHLNIVKESDYFGLKYEGSKGEELWLNLRNPIQVNGHGHTSPLRFALRVKFWVPPHLLLQESTRHQFYLHARLDLMENRLLASNWECIAKLIALIAQAEVGDYDPLNPPNNIYVQASNISPLESSVTPSDLLQRVIAEHKDMIGMKASTAEYWLLKEVSTLESFGEEMFQMKPGNIKLGVGPHGITKYEEGKEKQIIPFTAIQSAASHRRGFKLEYITHDNVLTHLETKLESNHAASGLYRAITEKHAFYSCETVRSAVTEQFIRDLKGTIVSIFNEDSSLGKKYVFDIRRTCREVYDNARRALYLENKMLGQVQEPTKDGCEGKQCKDSHERLARLLDAMTCRICMDNQIDTAFFPCAHIVACSTCASKCERCPLCRADIKQSQKVYLPAEFGESVY